ncbi:YeeE/YedE family protein [Achromobacter insuavis]|uniref:Membrane protein n=1 Tax=Achromobacter insuavis AXX-A TaxID=1003200 RepID=F7T8A6_9BURK|nr:YeeE/YedE family protein [Achromobacter insuavis]EGP43500.1 membrane protein [Achromobacter insuavis AXX-A]
MSTLETRAPPQRAQTGAALRYTLAAALLALVGAAAWRLAPLPDGGRDLSLSLLLGAAFGIVLQRSRFCFYCIARDAIERRDPRGAYAVLVALAVGTLGYHAVFGAFLPVPGSERLPPGAHIGPVSLALVAGAFVFGVGMRISGSCISAHFYRLGEGALASPFALLGAGVGFVLGFASWNTLYLSMIQQAPVVWLPHHLGYGGTVLLQGAALGLLALGLSRLGRGGREPASRLPVGARDASGQGPDGARVDPLARDVSPPVATDPPPWRTLLQDRWSPAVGGLLVAFIGVIAYLRIAPLGVTAELGSVARTAASAVGALPSRLEGLDTFAGCATAVKNALLSNNGAFVLALVAGAWAAALAANAFRPRLPTGREIVRNFTGGVLMGWGGMTALGCTVGTLLSGVMAGAASGWIFGVACVAGIWVALKLRPTR